MTLMFETGLVQTSKKGVKLGFNGPPLFNALGICPVDIDTGYALGSYKQAIKVSRVADKITNGINQVKLSTMFGGVGCTVWVMKDGTLYMPPHLAFNLANVEESNKIVDIAGLCDGDVLLVCGAEKSRAAKVAAMMVALDLV